jgi:hypothetical protein
MLDAGRRVTNGSEPVTLSAVRRSDLGRSDLGAHGSAGRGGRGAGLRPSAPLLTVVEGALSYT